MSKTTKPIGMDVNLAEAIAKEISVMLEEYQEEFSSFKIEGKATGRSFSCARIEHGKDEKELRWHYTRVYKEMTLQKVFVGNKRAGWGRVIFRFSTQIDDASFIVDADVSRLMKELGEDETNEMIKTITGSSWDDLLAKTQESLRGINGEEVKEVLSKPPPPDRDPEINGWGNWG